MDTDMGMEEKRMAKRRNKVFCTTLSLLLLSGCASSSLEITKNDILEVARDDANATKKECENVSIQEEKNAYSVSFDTSTGSYVYKIGKDGIIKDRSYKRTSTKSETSTTTKVQEPVKEPVKQEEKKTEEKKETTSFDENQQQAINSALANAGLEQDDVTDLTCTLDEANQQYTVTFKVGDIQNTVSVDSTSFVVLSSIQA